jgi:hypothetical protein
MKIRVAIDKCPACGRAHATEFSKFLNRWLGYCRYIDVRPTKEYVTGINGQVMLCMTPKDEDGATITLWSWKEALFDD